MALAGRAPYAGSSTSLNDFKQIALLGEGAYSSVYKVTRLADREIYALKKVKLPSLSEKERQNALNEVRLLASVTHSSIIAYKEAFFDEKSRCLCIVTEYADSGDLYQQILRCQKDHTQIRENDVWRWFFGMCAGLKVLHDMNILHRDLKCANVFLNSAPEGLVAKLGDFNVSKVAKRGLCVTQTGTPYYASPEVWRDLPYDAKSDMWSLGCVLYEMVALRPPFRAEDMDGLYRKITKGHYQRVPTHYSQDLADVIGSLLQVNPKHRPTVDQLLQMPVVRRRAPGVADAQTSPHDLLQTIKMPKNSLDIPLCLPKPRYEEAAKDALDAYMRQPRSSRAPAGIRYGELESERSDRTYSEHDRGSQVSSVATSNQYRSGRSRDRDHRHPSSNYARAQYSLNAVQSQALAGHVGGGDLRLPHLIHKV